MPDQININNPGDLAKLNGTKNEEFKLIVLPTGESALQITISHIAMEGKQVLIIFPRVLYNINGSIGNVSPGLSLNITPV